jgi:hypothetical protein
MRTAVPQTHLRLLVPQQSVASRQLEMQLLRLPPELAPQQLRPEPQ